MLLIPERFDFIDRRVTSKMVASPIPAASTIKNRAAPLGAVFFIVMRRFLRGAEQPQALDSVRPMIRHFGTIITKHWPC
jgi:hypothetical protein